MKIKITWLFIFFFSTHTFAQDSVRFYQTIDTLCSPYFYGRGYEQDGHIKAAHFLKQQFSAADTVFSQYFDLSINHLYGKMALNIDKKALNPCSDYIPLPQANSGKGKLKILYLDSMFFTDNTNQFIKKKINKKAIVYPEKFESKITSNPLLHEKIYSESGAILKTTSTATLKSFSPTAWMPPAFSVLDSLVTKKKKISFDLNQKIEKIESQNVIAVVKGIDPNRKEIIICAHYDHVGGYENCYISGANDNASGVAMLLELYRYFLMHKPKQTIRFIAFAGEEVGLVGSKYYVENISLGNTAFVLNLDLLGAGSEGVTVVNATVFKSQFELLDSINTKNKYLSQIKKRGGAANSDHYYFSKKGIPAFFIYSNGKVGGYHNITDTPSKLEKGSFENIFNLLKDFLGKL